MKKTAKTILSFIGGAALVAAAAGAAYGLNSGVRKWVDDQIGRVGSTDSDAPDSTVTSASGALSATVSGGSVFGAHGIKRAVAKGATKTVTFTVSPANATDKYVIVATSDPAKVSVSATRVLSGSAVTLTLVNGEFNGTVSITAHPEALASSVVTIPVTVYNFVTTLEYVGLCNPAGDDVYSFPGLAASDIASADVLYQTGSAAAPTVSFNYVDNEDHPAIILRAYGRDTSIAPDLKADLGVYKCETAASLALTAVGHEAYFMVDVASDWAVGSKTFTIEDGSKTVTLAAYVTPASMAGSGAVQFK